jgi:uncharacterized linocin/CFP29 family protein
MNPYDGDPKISITENGAEIDVENGQPKMEQGIENVVNISLFTKKGWYGNYYLNGNEKIGSDFEEKSKGIITADKINEVRQANLDALNDPIFGDKESVVTNPSGDFLKVFFVVAPPSRDPQKFLFLKNGQNWKNQIMDVENVN